MALRIASNFLGNFSKRVFAFARYSTCQGGTCRRSQTGQVSKKKQKGLIGGLKEQKDKTGKTGKETQPQVGKSCDDCLIKPHDDRIDKAMALIFDDNSFDIKRNNLKTLFERKLINERVYLKGMIMANEKEVERFHKMIFKLYALRIM